MTAESELRQILLAAVPDVPAPADRLDEIGHRVHRRRRRIITGSGLLTAVLAITIGVPVVLDRADHPPADAGCPVSFADVPDNGHRTGPLVPGGATEAVLCEVRTSLAVSENQNDPLAAPRVLRSDVAGLAAALNALPAHVGAQHCFDVGYTTEWMIVVRYPDRDPVYLSMDSNCGTVSSDGQLRINLPSPVDAFLKRYEAQSRGVPAVLPPADPPCPGVLRRDRRSPAWPWRDSHAGVDLPWRASGDPASPNPVVGVVGCRYTVGPREATLVRQARAANPGDWGDVLDALFPPAPSAADARCVDRGRPVPERMDVLLVVDATGVWRDVWVYRGACPAALDTVGRGWVPSRSLLSKLDGLLG